MIELAKSPRPIRSFVLRQGRMTPAQRSALDTLWGQYGIEPGTCTLDFHDLFSRNAPRILEIGFGMGSSLAEMAAAHPEQDYLGIEVHRPGIGNLLKNLDTRQLTNVRVICADAVEILNNQIPDASLDAIYLFFPDPWHKRRHHKRRIVQPPFVELIYSKLKPGGCFHLATDWEEYAQQMLEVLTAAPKFTNTSGVNHYAPRPTYRPLTKFEQRGQRLGHQVWDLMFTAAE
ncbi:MAG: tRNA (guanosine(46)-N7)-methyltransferase TrmB [Gammaproteobacteria bacterium]